MEPSSRCGLRYLISLLLIIHALSPVGISACDELFEGFGVHLGSPFHFERSPPGMVSKVFDKMYNELKIRYYRTSYESAFSPVPDVYEISCNESTPSLCSWIEIHEEMSKYADAKFMASIWSPPHHMKNMESHTLLVEKEKDYHYFIRNITELMKSRFNITIERVSPINEPENIFAPWEHTVMAPQQLCRMVHDFNDPLVSICPENAYFWVSEIYSNTTLNASVTCLESCEIFGTHAYALNLGGDDNFRVHYDLVPYPRKLRNIPIWQTEVSSTGSSIDQMREALDMSINIANFVGHTCIQRYYFWSAYTYYSSGESLVWGTGSGDLVLPKKYYVYKHFTHASYGGVKKVDKCNSENLEGVICLKFGDSKVVFVNNLKETVGNDYWEGGGRCVAGSFCCTTDMDDWDCSGDGARLLGESICSCDVSRS